jgi:hypothetical protein
MFLHGMSFSTFDEMRANGVQSDVTQRHAVLEVREEITSTMPPIVGVCQGASKYYIQIFRLNCAFLINPSASPTLAYVSY